MHNPLFLQSKIGNPKSKILLVRRTVKTLYDLHAMDREARLLTGTGLDFSKLRQNEDGQFEMRFSATNATNYTNVGAGLALPSGKDLLNHRGHRGHRERKIKMPEQTTEQRIRKMIIDSSDLNDLKPDELLPETTLENDLGITELDFITLCMDLEEEFDIEITDEEGDNLKTVADVVNLIKTKRPDLFPEPKKEPDLFKES